MNSLHFPASPSQYSNYHFHSFAILNLSPFVNKYSTCCQGIIHLLLLLLSILGNVDAFYVTLVGAWSLRFIEQQVATGTVVQRCMLVCIIRPSCTIKDGSLIGMEWNLSSLLPAASVITDLAV